MAPMLGVEIVDLYRVTFQSDKAFGLNLWATIPEDVEPFIEPIEDIMPTAFETIGDHPVPPFQWSEQDIFESDELTRRPQLYEQFNRARVERFLRAFQSRVVAPA